MKISYRFWFLLNIPLLTKSQEKTLQELFQKPLEEFPKR
jgi:hypothetical protein